MTTREVQAVGGRIDVGFPRFLQIGGWSINSYKCLLCVGIYFGTLATAGLAQSVELSPLWIGLSAMTCALAGLIGARLYHVAIHARAYLGQGSSRALFDTTQGGWSVFGGLLTFVPASLATAAMLGVPATVQWDCMSVGVLTGGFWIRLGCVFNGCCAGRETRSRFSVTLHDTRGVTKRRLPVQYLEMMWWLAGLGGFMRIWSLALPPGTYALAVLCWYGVGRFFLEPLREEPDVLLGKVRINQVVAGLIALTAGAGLALRAWYA